LASPKRVLKRLSGSVSRYPVRLDRGHFSSIGGSCHEEKESLVPSDVVDFSIVARQRVHYPAGPESCSAGSQGAGTGLIRRPAASPFTVKWCNMAAPNTSFIENSLWEMVATIRSIFSQAVRMFFRNEGSSRI